MIQGEKTEKNTEKYYITWINLEWFWNFFILFTYLSLKVYFYATFSMKDLIHISI